MTKHARLSPSNHRWSNCPGSVREEAKYPDIPGESAIDGTGTHLLLEMCLNHAQPPSRWKGTVIGVNHEDKPSGWMVNQDRIERVEICLEYLNRRRKELKEQFPNCELTFSSETKSNPGKHVGRDDWFGTVDITIEVFDFIKGRQFLEIVDFKDGRGFVHVKDNPQLISYIGGKLDFKNELDWLIRCRTTIVQPKTKPPIRYENYSVSDIKNKIDNLALAASLTDDQNAPLIPDNKNGKGYCNWCKHKKNCNALKNKQMEVFNMFDSTTSVSKDHVNIEQNNNMDNLYPFERTNSKTLFDQIVETFKNIENLSSENLSQLLDAKRVMDDIFKQAQEEAEKRIENGNTIPGYALLPSNSKREWAIEEDELVKILKARKFKKDDIYIAKLISPAQVLKHSSLTKQQKQKIEDNYIKIVPGNLKLQPVSREEKTEDQLDMFNDIVTQCDTKEEEVSFL